MVWKIIATLGLVVLNGFFVAAEFAAVGARLSRLTVEAESDHAVLGRMALAVKRRLDLYLSSCQLGVTLASLGLGAVTEPAVAALLWPILSHFNLSGRDLYGISFTVALAISTSLHIVIGEQAPKNWAIRYSDWLLPIVAPPLIVFTYLFYPLIWLLNYVTFAVLRLTGVKTTLDSHAGLAHTEEELRALLTQAVAQGTVGKLSGMLLTNAFDFGELRVRQIMVPRPNVDFLTLQQPIGQVLKVVQRSAFTRLPLCDGDIDHVVGLIHMKDLFAHLQLVPGKLRFIDERTPGNETIAVADGKPGSALHVLGSGEVNLMKIRREVLFVPELTTAPKLLRQFQMSRIHMAIVVDEYGATTGVVTLEDVLEELVGEIDDEFDLEKRTDFLPEGNGAYRVSGAFPMHTLRERLKLAELDTGEVDSVSGYVVQQLGRFPRPGDRLKIGPFDARVLTVHQKRVNQVLLTPEVPVEADSAVDAKG